VKRTLLFCAGLLLAGSAQAQGWSSLWLTPDQRGERLLRQGDAAAAARTYEDPRHKAYAELQAGDYQQAAQDFKGFDDSDAHYNRGNALAKGGELQQALQAYDSALARNPGNADAKHNRELVEQALKQQEQQQKQQGSSGKDQPQSGKDGQQKQDGSPGQQDQSGQQKDQQNQPGQQQNSSQQANAGKDGEQNQQQQSSGQNGQQNQNQPGKDQQNGAAQQQQDAAAPQPGQSGTQQDAEQSGDDKTQAQRDAAASLKQNPPAQSAQAARSAGQAQQVGADQSAVPSEMPRTEQQLAQQQWLRRIPDDPGGLLRRKFMIEHQLRQRGEIPQEQQP
jgi:Ca-activated chloride channel homolog